MAIFSVFGKAATGQRLERMRRSPNFKGDHFENLVSTDVTLKGASLFEMLREYRNRPADTAPVQPLPSVKTDLSALPGEGAWVVWFGHSSYLLKVEGVTILVDPVFSGNASPVSTRFTPCTCRSERRAVNALSSSALTSRTAPS